MPSVGSWQFVKITPVMGLIGTKTDQHTYMYTQHNENLLLGIRIASYKTAERGCKRSNVGTYFKKALGKVVQNELWGKMAICRKTWIIFLQTFSQI